MLVNVMVLIVDIPKEVNAVKEYLKQIEEETMELADRIKLDGQRRAGLEGKFKNAYETLDLIKPEQPKTRVVDAKVDIKTGIKKVT